ncbi:CPBP family glutamic-type intramembrane protease [Nocardia fluminea]|uniref:CAAX prenyl protease-like protein n=1 Tax=Nocardia fluminea TaxID=134984 RepID=A0A2N3VL60_9NOCA|nr:CPBP family glutamic-type intramembrane protease [Nocardia fluminea]PKV82360.1 CAAX prenyl protease-like protein [Nocardia fluminea]
MTVDPGRAGRKTWLTIEFVVLFFGLTGLFAVYLRGVSPLPFLAAITVGLVIYLRRTGFDHRSFWRADTLRPALPAILTLWAISAVALAVAVAVLRPGSLFDLPRERPLIWVLVLVFYPLVSVYPQELLFRAFLFHRYAPIFGDGARMIAASAIAFGFAHVIVGNWISVLLSAAAGALFAARYRRTRSLLTTSVEHALYGILVFTVGLGDFFYHGAATA